MITAVVLLDELFRNAVNNFNHLKDLEQDIRLAAGVLRRGLTSRKANLFNGPTGGILDGACWPYAHSMKP